MGEKSKDNQVFHCFSPLKILIIKTKKQMKTTKNVLPLLLLTALVFLTFKETNAQTKNQADRKTKQLRMAVISSIDYEKKSITAIEGDTTYTIDASSAIILRALGGTKNKADLTEMMVNDNIFVIGTKSENNANVIVAKKIRDYSIYKREFFGGTITATNNTEKTDSWGKYSEITLESTKKKKDKVTTTIRVYSTTAIKLGKTTKTFSDLHIGDIVVVKGIWNNKNSVVYKTSQINILGKPSTKKK